MKRLLVVVDFQKDFVDGALGFPGAEKLEKPIADKIRAYYDRCDEVVFTLDTHRRDYLETQEGRNLPVEHCVDGTPGHELFGETARLAEHATAVFKKPTFGSGELFEWLRTAEPPFESIELVGLVSNICVISNAIVAKTACPEVPVIVDAACTASFDDALNEKALDVLEGLQVQVINRA